MELETIQSFPAWAQCLTYALFAAFFTAFVSGLMAYFWVVRPFDRLLGERNASFEHGIFFASAVLRITRYGTLIATTRKPNWYDDNLYGDFDFRGQSTPRQRIVSRAFSYSMNTMLVLSVWYWVYVRWLAPTVVE